MPGYSNPRTRRLPVVVEARAKKAAREARRESSARFRYRRFFFVFGLAFAFRLAARFFGAALLFFFALGGVGLCGATLCGGAAAAFASFFPGFAGGAGAGAGAAAA